MTVQNNVGTVLLCCAENGWWAFVPCNITLTSARCYNFTTPSSMEKYRIITHFTLLIDDYSPLGGPPDPSEWFTLWEVPETSWNEFPPGKSPRPLRMIFLMGSPPHPSEYRRWCPFPQLPPPPPLIFKSTFPSYVFLPTWRFSPSSLNYLQTSAKLLVVQQGCHLEARTRDLPRLLRTWPPATFMVK